MSSNEINIGIRIDADGKAAANEVKATTGEIDKLGKATHEASSEAERLNASLRNQTLQMASARDAIRQNSVAVTETAGSVTKLLDKYDQTGAKLRQLQADFKALDQAASSGKIAGKDDARLDSVYAKIKAEIKSAESSAAGFGPAANAGFAQATAGAEKSAFATAGARRELMVLGHEVVQGNFSRIPGSMMVLAERTGMSTAAFIGLGGAVVGVSAIVGTFAVAAHQGTEEMKAMSAAMGMTGNFSGQTADTLLGLARNASEASHQTVGATKEMVTALAESGHIGEAAFGSITQAAVLYSQASGKSLDEVTPKLIKAFEDPAKGAAELNNTLHFLSPAELEHIKNLQEMGDVSAAQSALAEELNQKLAGIQPSLGTLETAWEGVKKAASSAWDAMMSAGRKNTLGEELDQAKSKLAGMQQALQEYRQGSRGRFFAPSQAEIDQQQSYIKGLEEKKAAQNESAKAASAAAAENERTAATWDMITKSSGAYHKQQLQNQIDRIKGYKAANAEEAKLQADSIANLQKQIDGPAKKAVAESATAYNSLVKSIEGRIAVAEAESTTTEKLSAGQAAYAKFTELVGSGVLKLTDTEKQNVTALLKKEIAIEKANAATEKARKINSEWVASNAKQAQSIQQSNASLEADIVSLARHNEEIGLSTEQLAALTLRRMDDTVAAAEQRLAQTDLTDANADYVSGLMDQVRLLREKRGLMADGQIMQAAAEQAKSTGEEWKNLWSTVENTGKSVFVGILSEGRGAFEGIGKAIKASVIDLLYQLTAKKWLISIGASLGVPGISAAGAAQGAGSGALSMASSGGSLINVGSSALGVAGNTISALGTGATSIGGIFGATGAEIGAAATYGTAVGSQTTAMIAAQEMGMGATGMMGSVTGALSAIPVWGWAAMAALAVFGLMGRSGGPKIEGNAYGTANASGSLNILHGADYAAPYGDGDWNRPGADAARVESVLTPAVQGISSFARQLGGVTEGLGFFLGYNTDPKGTAPDNVSSGLRDASGNVIYQASRDAERGKGLEMMPAEINRLTLATLQSIDLKSVWNPLLDSLGDVSKLADNQISSALDTVRALGKQTATTFSETFGEAFDIEKIKGLSREGENAIQTFARLSQTFQATNQVADMLGQSTVSAFGAIGLASEAMRQKLIDGAGGLEALTKKTDFFYQNFYTDAERAQKRYEVANKTVTESFAEMGLTVPTTTQGFRDLVEGLDLSTDTGQKLFQSLMDIAPAFSIVANSAANAAASMRLSAASYGSYTAEQVNAGGETSYSMTNTNFMPIPDVHTATGVDLTRFQDTRGGTLTPGLVVSSLNRLGMANSGGYADSLSRQSAISTLVSAGVTDSFGNILDSARVPKHATGLARVPYDDYRADLHANEMVLDAATADSLRRYGIPTAAPTRDSLSGSGADLAKEIQQLREELADAMYAIAKNTRDTAKTLHLWDGDGQPPVRPA